MVLIYLDLIKQNLPSLVTIIDINHTKRMYAFLISAKNF